MKYNKGDVVKDMTVYMRGVKLVLSYNYRMNKINVLSGDLGDINCNVGGCINANVIGGINGDVLVGINGNVFGGVNGDVDDNVIDIIDNKSRVDDWTDIGDNMQIDKKGNIINGLMK